MAVSLTDMQVHYLFIHMIGVSRRAREFFPLMAGDEANPADCKSLNNRKASDLFFP